MKLVTIVVIFALVILALPQTVIAEGVREGVSSFLLPGSGQAMNNQFGTTKTKIMAGVEVASIATLAVLGSVVGGPIIWAGLGPLLGNHAWSAVDAYYHATPEILQHQRALAEADRIIQESLERQRRRGQGSNR